MIDVALGNEPADLAITNGRVVNTLTREIYVAGVAIKGDRIAAVGDIDYAIGENTEVVDAEKIDLVILDLTVRGGMGGVDAMQALMEFDPRVRAVVSSGYSNDMVLEKYADHGFRSVLPKPYRMDEMGQVLGRVLSS